MSDYDALLESLGLADKRGQLATGFVSDGPLVEQSKPPAYLVNTRESRKKPKKPPIREEEQHEQ